VIFGVGIDLVEVARVERLLAAYGERFYERVLAPSERAGYLQSARQVWFLATRFAAKEAVSKALGTGLRYPVTLHAISVVNDAVGRPALRFHGALPDYLKKAGVGEVHLSLTHEKGLACAVAVAEAVR
jgi:holo-[acyl-carrier protein] synthase